MSPIFVVEINKSVYERKGRHIYAVKYFNSYCLFFKYILSAAAVMCNVLKRRSNNKRFNLIKQLTPNIKINCSCKTQPVGVSTTTPSCVQSISGSYLALRRHGAREEEVGDGGEEEAAGGDEKPHPPGPHPAGVAQPQLRLRLCQTHPQRSATIAQPGNRFLSESGSGWSLPKPVLSTST